MKRILSILLIFILAVSLIGCGGNDQPVNEPPAEMESEGNEVESLSIEQIQVGDNIDGYIVSDISESDGIWIIFFEGEHSFKGMLADWGVPYGECIQLDAPIFGEDARYYSMPLDDDLMKTIFLYGINTPMNFVADKHKNPYEDGPYLSEESNGKVPVEVVVNNLNIMIDTMGPSGIRGRVIDIVSLDGKEISYEKPIAIETKEEYYLSELEDGMEIAEGVIIDNIEMGEYGEQATFTLKGDFTVTGTYGYDPEYYDAAYIGVDEPFLPTIKIKGEDYGEMEIMTDFLVFENSDEVYDRLPEELKDGGETLKAELAIKDVNVFFHSASEGGANTTFVNIFNSWPNE